MCDTGKDANKVGHDDVDDDDVDDVDGIPPYKSHPNPNIDGCESRVNAPDKLKYSLHFLKKKINKIQIPSRSNDSSNLERR